MGSSHCRNLKVVFPAGGHLTQTEFAALAHQPDVVGGNGWTGLLVNQGAAANAATFKGDVKITEKLQVGPDRTDILAVVNQLLARVDALEEENRQLRAQRCGIKVFETAVPHNAVQGEKPGYSGHALHLVSKVEIGKADSNLMFHLRFTGYNFRRHTPFDIVFTGYQYGERGLWEPRITHTGPPGAELRAYTTRDGYLAFALSTGQANVQWHASSLSIEFVAAPNDYLQRGLAALQEGFHFVGHSAEDR